MGKTFDGRTPRRTPAFLISIVVATAIPVVVVAAGRFTDVPASNVHHDDIAWLAEAGVTVGCNPPANDRFCPEQPVLRQQMASFLRRLAENRVVHAATADRVSGQLLSLTPLNTACPASSISADPTFRKILDVGTFETAADGSRVVATFDGRVFVGNFSSGTGAIFELRVDDRPPSTGRARISLRREEAGGPGVQGSMTGVFEGLGRGTHTVSIWVRTSQVGAATQVMVDPGCWGTDQVVVEEYAG